MHAIRLRGPWEYEPLARATLQADGSLILDDRDLPAAGTMQIPGDWSAALGSDFRGLVRFTRRFAEPTGLGDGSRVSLRFENVDWQAVVALNGKILGEIQLAGTDAAPCLFVPPGQTFLMSPVANPCPWRFDITGRLAPRNRLEVDVLLPAVAAGTALSRPGREGQSGGLIGLVSLEIESV